MATATTVSSVLLEIQSLSTLILSTISAIDPDLALPTATITEIEKLASLAVSAWAASATSTINASTVLALLPNQAALTNPTTD